MPQQRIPINDYGHRRSDIRDMYEYQTFSPNKAIFNVAALAIFGFFGYKFITHVSEQKKKDEADRAISTNINAQVASALKDSIYNVGISTWIATFDQDAVFALADRITDLEKVRSYYHTYHNRNLDADLRDQASPQELQEFYRRAEKTKSQEEVEAIQSNPITTGSNTAPKQEKDLNIKGKYVVVKNTITAANVRKIPSQGSFFNNTMIYTLPKEVVVGIATGNYVKDTENNVGFVEVAFRIDSGNWNIYKTQGLANSIPTIAHDFYTYLLTLNSAVNTQQKVWIAKSLVDFVPSSNITTVSKGWQWYSGVTLSGLSGNEPTLYVKENHIAPIYDTKMKLRGYANDRHCLGGLISTLNTPKGKLYQFENTQGKKRWVAAQYVKLK